MSKIGKDGKPIDKSYLEVGLPKGVTEDINNYLEAKRTNDSCLDCYWCELYGTINSVNCKLNLNKLNQKTLSIA